MSSTTTTTISGNLTRDPEIRYTRDGQATTSLGVAVNRRWQNRDSKEWEEATSFFDVVCWRELAENTALSLITRGSRPS
jgi:single-strand DNA-binding protein